jgi:hypothetical protein
LHSALDHGCELAYQPHLEVSQPRTPTAIQGICGTEKVHEQGKVVEKPLNLVTKDNDLGGGSGRAGGQLGGQHGDLLG